MQLLRVKLSRRGQPPRNKHPLRTATDVADFVRRRIGRDAAEKILVILLNSDRVPLGFLEFTTGSPEQCRVSPAEVAKAALLANATAVILAHNNPSGNREFSAADEALTRSLSRALQLFEIELFDHVLVGPRGRFSASFNSMRSHGLLPATEVADSGGTP